MDLLNRSARFAGDLTIANSSLRPGGTRQQFALLRRKVPAALFALLLLASLLLRNRALDAVQRLFARVRGSSLNVKGRSVALEKAIQELTSKLTVVQALVPADHGACAKIRGGISELRGRPRRSSIIQSGARSSVRKSLSWTPVLQAAEEAATPPDSAYQSCNEEGDDNEEDYASWSGDGPGVARSSLHRMVRSQSACFREMGARFSGDLPNVFNELVSELWPRINKFVDTMLHETVEPLINASLPGLLKGGVRFDKVTLGQSSPNLGPITFETDEAGTIEIHLGMKFESDLALSVEAIGVRVGIEAISFNGELVILLTPKKASPPFFGGVQIFFPNTPKVGIHFTGAAKLVNLPSLCGAVRSAIQKGIASACVLPRRIAIDLDDQDDVDITDMMYPEPIGVLRVTLWSGTGLTEAETPIGDAKPDPYVVASLGLETWTSPVASKTSDPVWGSGTGLIADFAVHNDSQALSLAVFDQDFAYTDDIIGEAKPVSVGELSGDSTRKVDVPLLDDEGFLGAGSLTISAELLTLSDDEQAARAQRCGPSLAYLSLKIGEVNDLGSTDAPFTVRLRVWEAGPSPQTGGEGSGRFQLLGLCPSRIRLGRSADRHVIAEAVTKKSSAKPELQLAKAMHDICSRLDHMDWNSSEIADVLGVGEDQVRGFLRTHGDSPAETKRLMRSVAMERSATKPCFNEVLQVLLPEVGGSTAAEVAVFDRRGQQLGSTSILLTDITSVTEREPDLLILDNGARVSGSLRLRWLASSASAGRKVAAHTLPS